MKKVIYIAYMDDCGRDDGLKFCFDGSRPLPTLVIRQGAASVNLDYLHLS